MEDVLDVYERPYDANAPVVCVDETCKEIHAEVREPIAARPASDEKPGAPVREDFEYLRHGSASIFMIYEPLTGRCHAESSERRTREDYARIIKYICDNMFPNAEKIVLVQDNLNTHTIGSLYHTFEAKEAHRLAGRLEIHYTPKHGSWLNMAEIALRLLCNQCLARRFPSREQLARQIDAWTDHHKKSPMKTDWRFTTADARIKLKRLYPKIGQSTAGN